MLILCDLFDSHKATKINERPNDKITLKLLSIILIVFTWYQWKLWLFSNVLWHSSLFAANYTGLRTRLISKQKTNKQTDKKTNTGRKRNPSICFLIRKKEKWKFIEYDNTMSFDCFNKKPQTKQKTCLPKSMCNTTSSDQIK